jgi:hypothetical protein
LASQCSEQADLLVPEYFSADEVNESCDVITSCACFYDVDDPNQWVADVAELLTPDGIWVNQLTDAVMMLKNTDFMNICHEHVTYWDIYSLAALYERHGLSIRTVTYNDVNGGSIRVIASKGGHKTNLVGHAAVTMELAQGFAKRTERWKSLMREILFEMPSVRNEPIWGYAASTKGCAMLQYLNANERFVAIADRNPAKHGLMMAGCWIPIVDELALRRAQPKYVMPLAFAFKGEFNRREAALRESGTTFIYPLPNPEFVL